MFEYLVLNMWKDGTEHCTAYESFKLDKREISWGASYRLVNDHIKNNWVIEKWNANTFIGIADKGKEETLCLDEFKKWLADKNIPDAYMEWLRANPDYVKRYPHIAGKEFI